MQRSKQIKPEIDKATQKCKEITKLRDAEVSHIGNIVVGPSKDSDGNLVYETASVPISNDEVQFYQSFNIASQACSLHRVLPNRRR